MQKHSNVLQYRASYCSEQSDFYTNCQNLSPESELITTYRDNPVSEKCPLSGLYVLQPPSSSSSNTNNDDRSYRSSNNMNSKCLENHYKESMIMECSDHSMLKLQFGKCTNMPSMISIFYNFFSIKFNTYYSFEAFIVNCVGHWTEGNTNYLIGKVSTNPSQKPTYKCIVYTENNGQTSSGSAEQANRFQNQRQSRYSNSQDSSFYSDFIDLSSQNSEYSIDNMKANNIQISISQDEFCRNIDNQMIDDQMTFSFNRVQGSKYHVAPPQLSNRIRSRRQLNLTNYIISRPSIISNSNQRVTAQTCKFPKWLNKKWHNLKQTKLFTLDYKLDSLLVLDEKNSIVINKYTCSHMKSRKSNHVQAIVKTLNGCSSGYQCLTISSKSEFVLEIKFGKISYESPSSIDCNDSNHISQEFVYVDTNYGVKCPLSNCIYEKLNPKVSMHRSTLSDSDDISSIQRINQQEPCKYLTQTQTLQVGCVSDQQYSLKTKLCYPNHQYSKLDPVDQHVDEKSPRKLTTTAYTQLESEINLVCLAYWKHDGNHVIVSRTMTNEILCSVIIYYFFLLLFQIDKMFLNKKK
jgi:hypothetical protein